MKLENKIAVVTGAGSGIGRAIAARLAAEGAKIILTDVSKDGLEQTLEIIKKAGGAGEIFGVDLRKIDEIVKFVQAIKESEGRVDILVNVAGIWHSKDKAFSGIEFTDYSINEISDTYAVGLAAPTILSHEIIPLMEPGGKIINISGTFESGAKGWLPYFVSKKAIEDLTVGLSQELRNRQIQVNCVSPSDVASPAYKKFFPEFANPQTALQPKDVADLVLFLASEEARSPDKSSPSARKNLKTEFCSSKRGEK